MEISSKDDDCFLEPSKVSVYIDRGFNLLNNFNIFWGSDNIKKKAKGSPSSYSVIICDGKVKRKVVFSGPCDDGNPIFHAIAESIDIKNSCEPMALRIYAHFSKKNKDVKFMIGQIVLNLMRLKRVSADGNWQAMPSLCEDVEVTQDVSQPCGQLVFKAWVVQYNEINSGSKGGISSLFAKSTPNIDLMNHGGKNRGNSSSKLMKLKKRFKMAKKPDGIKISKSECDKTHGHSKSMNDLSVFNDEFISETDTDASGLNHGMDVDLTTSRFSSASIPSSMLSYPEESNPFNVIEESTNLFEQQPVLHSLGNLADSRDRSRSMYDLGTMDSSNFDSQVHLPTSLSRATAAALGTKKRAETDVLLRGAGVEKNQTSERSRSAVVTRTPSAKARPGIHSFTPHQVSLEGGELLTVYGTKLGNCEADVVAVRVAGQEYIGRQVERHSSSKLTLWLRPAISCRAGPIEVETKSMGLIVSSSAFAFVNVSEADRDESVVSPQRVGSLEGRTREVAVIQNNRRVRSHWDLSALACSTPDVQMQQRPDSPGSQRSSGLGSETGVGVGSSSSATLQRRNSSGFFSMFKKGGSGLKKKELLVENERLRNDLENAQRELSQFRRNQHQLEQRCVELEILLADSENQVLDYKSKMEGYLLCILDGKSGPEALKTLELPVRNSTQQRGKSSHFY